MNSLVRVKWTHGARGSESEDKVIGDKRMEACTLNMEEAATRS